MSVYEREMLAFLTAVKKWSFYLLGRHFKIKTDHGSLKFLLDQSTCTIAQNKWLIQMMNYDFELIFRKCSSNMATDALFRHPSIQLLTIYAVSTDVLQRIQHSWISDASLVHIIHKAKSSTYPLARYTWINGQLRRKGKLVVGADEQLKHDLLHFFHSSTSGGHSGMDATLKRISSVVY